MREMLEVRARPLLHRYIQTFPASQVNEDVAAHGEGLGAAEARLRSLRCDVLRALSPDSPQVAEIQKLIVPAGAAHALQPKLLRAFELRKEGEWDGFNPASLPNVRVCPITPYLALSHPISLDVARCRLISNDFDRSRLISPDLA